MVVSGWLKKKGGIGGKQWQPRFFVMESDTVTYSKSEDTTKTQGSIALASVSRVAAVPGDSTCRSFTVTTTTKTFTLQASSATSCRKWIQLLSPDTRPTASSMQRSSPQTSPSAPSGRKEGSTTAAATASGGHGIANKTSRSASSTLALHIRTDGGYLNKLGGQRKNWKRRYFVIRDSSLHYYPTLDDCKAQRNCKGTVKLLNLRVAAVADSLYGRPCVFSLTTSGTDRVFYLQASNKQESDAWIDALDNNIKRVSAIVAETATFTPPALAQLTVTKTSDTTGGSVGGTYARAEGEESDSEYETDTDDDDENQKSMASKHGCGVEGATNPAAAASAVRVDDDNYAEFVPITAGRKPGLFARLCCCASTPSSSSPAISDLGRFSDATRYKQKMKKGGGRSGNNLSSNLLDS